MWEEDKAKAVLQTSLERLYECKVMASGLCSGHATLFVMSQTLADLSWANFSADWKDMIVFLDLTAAPGRTTTGI